MAANDWDSFWWLVTLLVTAVLGWQAGRLIIELTARTLSRATTSGTEDRQQEGLDCPRS